MTTVKYAVSAYTADGTTTDYLITWDYLDEDHIAVYVDGTSNADPTANHTFTKLNNTTLRITDGIGGAVASGADIEIRRETPLLTRAITFADGSALLAEDLNKNSDYLLYSMQEVLDTVDAAAQDGALAAEVATTALRDESIVLKADTLAARDTTQGYLATVQSDATDADNHRIATAASEAAALSSENAAAASETASANSATASANSATDSAASAAAGLASEQAADVSEAAAAASEAAAAASQVAATTSEANAATSESNAAASFDSFDDRYLGAKASAPTLDNDGDALQTGALYWNSTSDTMYVWNGTAWDTFNSTTGIADGATSTAMTLDASGNLMVGKATADSGATAGIETSNNGRINATRNGSISGVFNRLTSDGDIVQFRKDGSTVGSIGSRAGFVRIGAGDTGLEFHSGDNTIYSADISTGGLPDGSVNLGSSDYRFKDLHLSGTLHSERATFGYERITRKPHNSGVGGTHLIPRVKEFGHGGGATQYATFNVTSDFGMSFTGGALIMGFHGWSDDYAHGLIEWQNGGGSDGLLTARFRGQSGGVGVSVYPSSFYNLTVRLTSTHTNSHGWQWFIMGPK